MRIVPFEPDHLNRLLLQPSQAVMQPTLTSQNYGENLAKSGPAFSLVDGDSVLACSGLIPQWDNRALAWALISAEAGSHFLAVHRGVKRAIELYPYRRIETAVKSDFSEGHRWMGILGFAKEGTMRGYAPDGCDYDLYARIKNV